MKGLKKCLSILSLLCAIALALTGCGQKESEVGASDLALSADNFVPETTAVSGGLTGALELQEAEAADASSQEGEAISDEAVTVDGEATADEAASAQAGEAASTTEAQTLSEEVPAEATPTATPEPAQEATAASAAAISGYGEVTSEELGFKFSYPVNWENQPGRSTVCYLQQKEDGSYPARVCITMKKLPHTCNDSKAQAQLVSYLKKLREQYDYDTFEVDMNLDVETTFMGRKGMSTTYMAYDGDQEIKGYVILTYFDKYVFCYHFLCAYDDYKSFESAISFMRESAQCILTLEDD